MSSGSTTKMTLLDIPLEILLSIIVELDSETIRLCRMVSAEEAIEPFDSPWLLRRSAIFSSQ